MEISKLMSFAAGIIVFILTIAIALYMGIWVCFAGGIMNIVAGFSAQPWVGILIAWGAVKMLFSGVVGWGCAAIGWSFGLFLIKLSD